MDICSAFPLVRKTRGCSCCQFCKSSVEILCWDGRFQLITENLFSQTLPVEYEIAVRKPRDQKKLFKGIRSRTI